MSVGYEGRALRSQLQFAADLLTRAAGEYAVLPDEFERAVPRLSETGVFDPEVLIQALDLTSHLRTALEWVAWGVRLEFGQGVEGHDTVSFPVPVAAAKRQTRLNSLRRQFPGVETTSPRVFAFLGSVVENQDGAYDWLPPLHRLWNQMKHRAPIAPAVRMLRTEAGGTLLWVFVETDQEPRLDFLPTLAQAGRESRKVVLDVARLSGIDVIPDLIGLKDDFL